VPKGVSADDRLRNTSQGPTPDTGALPFGEHGSCVRTSVAARIDGRAGGERLGRADEGVQRGADLRGGYPVRRPTLWGARTRPLALTWASTRPARIR
jgi:hypothetical protein